MFLLKQINSIFGFPFFSILIGQCLLILFHQVFFSLKLMRWFLNQFIAIFLKVIAKLISVIRNRWYCFYSGKQSFGTCYLILFLWIFGCINVILCWRGCFDDFLLRDAFHLAFEEKLRWLIFLAFLSASWKCMNCILPFHYQFNVG